MNMQFVERRYRVIPADNSYSSWRSGGWVGPLRKIRRFTATGFPFVVLRYEGTKRRLFVGPHEEIWERIGTAETLQEAQAGIRADLRKLVDDAIAEHRKRALEQPHEYIGFAGLEAPAKGSDSYTIAGPFLKPRTPPTT